MVRRENRMLFKFVFTIQTRVYRNKQRDPFKGMQNSIPMEQLQLSIN